MEKRDSPTRTSPGYSAEDFIHPLASLREAAKAGSYAGLAYFLDMCLTEATIQADAEARNERAFRGESVSVNSDVAGQGRLL